MELTQYQIVIVNLDPTIGSEIKKTRPCLVISPDEMNKYLKTVVVAPLTSSVKNYPTRVPVTYQGRHGSIAIDQIRTIDKSRVVHATGHISSAEILQVKKVIEMTYVK